MGIISKLKHLIDLKSTGSSKGIISKSVIAQYLPANPIIIEAGAYIGDDTAGLSRQFPKGTIHAFEPVPVLYSQLSKRTRPHKNVICHPLALSNQPGEAVMYVSQGASNASSSLLRPKDHLIDHPDVRFTEMIHVQCTTLDDWVAESNIERVDFLWLDMQGHELNALKSGLKVLEKVVAIYTEVNLKEVYEDAPLYNELRIWLERQGFEVVLEELPWQDAGNVLFVRRDHKSL